MSAGVEELLLEMPVIAILRGLRPEEATDIGDALVEAGIRIIEVPLNSPEPLDSIRRLARHLDGRAVVGAGTVVSADDLPALVDAGARIVVSPNCSEAVIEAALAGGAVPVPGFATATEAFAAYRAGARLLKLFPASTYGESHVGALRAVLPTDAGIVAVGGVGPGNAGSWLEAGAAGVGIGSDLYRPGSDAELVNRAATAIVTGLRQTGGRS